MAPVRDARYNIRRKFDNTPARKGTTVRAKKQNVQQRQEAVESQIQPNQLQHQTSPYHCAFPTFDITRARTSTHGFPRLRINSATTPKHPPPAATTTC